jgi:hypothetical protein
MRVLFALCGFHVLEQTSQFLVTSRSCDITRRACCGFVTHISGSFDQNPYHVSVPFRRGHTKRCVFKVSYTVYLGSAIQKQRNRISVALHSCRMQRWKTIVRCPFNVGSIFERCSYLDEIAINCTFD